MKKVEKTELEILEEKKQEKRKVIHPIKKFEQDLSYYDIESIVLNLEEGIKQDEIMIANKKKMLEVYKPLKEEMEKSFE